MHNFLALAWLFIGILCFVSYVPMEQNAVNDSSHLLPIRLPTTLFLILRDPNLVLSCDGPEGGGDLWNLCTRLLCVGREAEYRFVAWIMSKKGFPGRVVCLWCFVVYCIRWEGGPLRLLICIHSVICCCCRYVNASGQKNGLRWSPFLYSLSMGHLSMFVHLLSRLQYPRPWIFVLSVTWLWYTMLCRRLHFIWRHDFVMKIQIFIQQIYVLCVIGP